MKTENKYYIPKLEEFHVGFEYEEDDSNTNNWEKQIIGTDNTGDLEFLKDMIIEGNCRVKHLDKDDIEKFGFKNSKLEKSLYLYSKKIKLYPHLESTTIGINFNEGIRHVLIFYVPDENNVPAGINLFVGQIKNKSELKRLLVQLNIIKE